ncbi:MAG: FAD-dependent oxidoreductase [Ignavibacteriae bacterium]|nr:FAD-dependent oxidoreductase [Ignavibacteriota bacterium]
MAKPVIMTVDDDPQVLAAIERDLRVQYQNEYRIVKAGSPAEALDAARQLKQRGTPVALFLVDQRMPDMTGTEFLAEVVGLHPEARKVLLTAYADTSAAIDSINRIGLDHYLMKPWDPPDQKLYPVLDDLLADWKSHARPPYDGIRIAGANLSPQSYEVRDFLSRNQVPYQWVDIDEDAAMRKLIGDLPEGLERLPVVFFPDGSYVRGPSQTELARKIGLQTEAQRPFYDVIVIGGGPAGLANTVYAASEGMRVVLIEQSGPGGQAGTSSMIENYLGFPHGITGADLAQRATAQAKRFGAEILTAQKAVRIRRQDPYKIVHLEDGKEISAYAVVLTTGMAVRRLDVPGVEAFSGRGIYYGVALSEAAAYRGRNVCIVGGANSAGQAALFFSRYARRVSILVRAPDISPGMSHYLVQRVKVTDNIDVVPKVEVVAVCGNGQLEHAVVRDVDTGSDREISTAALFICIGTAPHSGFVDGLLELNDKGFILTGPDLPRINGRPRGWALDRDPLLFETNVPGVFAAGDVRAGANRRVAAAVGEGSAAIYSVHRYLSTV